MLIETLTVNTLHLRRKHDKNIHSNTWGRENLAEAPTCLSGSEASQLQYEDTHSILSSSTTHRADGAANVCWC